ncbi:MAG: DUF5924 family protein [Oleiphilaceae bacterium]|nr:DUF5924 family protein [Oleiphilaceae bacterium]
MKTRLKWPVLRLAVRVRRHPYLFALVGFTSGIASFVLVERQEDMAGFIALFMLLSWLWLVLETPIRRALHHLFGLDLPPSLVRFTTQLVHQESYFFVLPFFLVTTTWSSAQALFSGLLMIAALISITDPLYYGWLAKRRWLFLAYHALALFVLLLTALPIIFHLSTPQSYALATFLAMIFALPSLVQAMPMGGWRGALSLTGVVLALTAVTWFGRLGVPPATLRLTEGVITQTVDASQRSAGKGRVRLSAEALDANGLFAYTAIRAPRGLNERIYHQWRHNGHERDRIALDIQGGREEGYRAWTHKLTFPPNPEGRWQVRVLTEGGQQIGQMRFSITD